MGANPTLTGARRVWAWITKQKLTAFSARDAYMANRAAIETMDELQPCLDLLVVLVGKSSQFRESFLSQSMCLSELFQAVQEAREGWAFQALKASGFWIASYTLSAVVCESTRRIRVGKRFESEEGAEQTFTTPFRQ